MIDGCRAGTSALRALRCNSFPNHFCEEMQIADIIHLNTVHVKYLSNEISDLIPVLSEISHHLHFQLPVFLVPVLSDVAPLHG